MNRRVCFGLYLRNCIQDSIDTKAFAASFPESKENVLTYVLAYLICLLNPHLFNPHSD